MSSSGQIDSLGTLDAAIAVCDDNIKRHSSLAVRTLISGALLLFALVTLAGGYADLTAKITDNHRLELSSDVQKNQKTLELLKEAYGTSIELAKRRLAAAEESKPPDNATDKEVQKWLASKDRAEEMLSESENVLKEETNAARAALDAAQETLDKYTPAPLISKELMIGFVGLSVLIISVFTGMYRFHQKEITKNEHHKLGFMRIRIAANNADREGFKDEVRAALTLNAFSVPSDSLFGKKEKEIESPLPGHPTSDLATGMVNKLLEQVDVVLKPKSS